MLTYRTYWYTQNTVGSLHRPQQNAEEVCHMQVHYAGYDLLIIRIQNTHLIRI